MAEVNQVPETAVSPEIVDNFSRPATGPYVHPTPPSMRAITPVEELTHTVDYDAFNQKYRVGTPDKPNPVPGAPYSSFRPEDMMLVAAAGAPRVVGATVGRLIAKSLPRDARALATYANDLSKAAAVLSKADVAATPNAAAALRKVMYRGEKGGPGALKTWFFGGTPSAERTINMAYAKKMGGQSPMSDEMADHIVKAADKLSAEISTALKSPRGAAKADTTKMKAAMVALSSELKSGAEAYRSRGVWNMAKDSGGWVGGKLKAAAASASGVRRYKAGSMKASRSIFGFAGSLADWGLSKIPGISPAALDTAQKYIGGTLGAAPLGVASAGAIVGLYDKSTKPSRDEAGAAAGDAAAAEAYRRAYGAEPPKAAPAAPAAQQPPGTPAATAAPAAPAMSKLNAAFYF